MISIIGYAESLAMMGCQTSGQERPYYSFNLEDHVPLNHLLRGIGRFLDLCELRQHLADYRWFCRLEDAAPDHSSFSKNRHGRFRESGTFRHLFETVLERCMTEGLVRGEGFATDASRLMRNVNARYRARKRLGQSHEAARPVREYLAALETADPSDTPPRSVSLTDSSGSRVRVRCIGKRTFWTFG